jgi:23S rRNA (cytidine1920-2'-O)/16S rRNA (cytidine1409-2'-O)-methyltransferase
MATLERKRLDVLLVEKGLAESRLKAKALIMAGKVLVDTLLVDKPGATAPVNSQIVVKDSDLQYVSRGGLKLEAGLKSFEISVSGLVCMDVGASTGGFTDCLIKHGAQKVYAVDVGYGQLAWTLRQDPRVHVIERTNIRHMPIERIPELIDLITIDTSFISLKIVVPVVRKFLVPRGRILALIKPQFEVGKGHVGKGGVVRSTEQHLAVIDSLNTFFIEQGFGCGQVVPSPIMGPKGNQEFIILLFNHPF